ncbi:stearoyl-CoA desaturase 5-like isoform X1 [Branchiostoma floridae]|uniref:Stearoyl-CoA desaturase 5-like isoform X1 n=1 Tax=Branchiostoma floridae TaxID=7739 RepID=A0A9J7MJ66_BRAFL|nr:stearoyl-CoA desaturase 5-like isoform X1 [Branchiostoma floridae]
MAPRNDFGPPVHMEVTKDLPSPTAQDGKAPPTQIVWRNVVIMSLLHMGAIFGLFLLPSAHPYTLMWVMKCLCSPAVICYSLSALGVTAGAHRLWAHRSYKARLPLRIFLAIINCMSLQNDIYDWSRDHRVHHKYSETPADPHNAKRGFFFAHIGWLLVRKHPDVITKGKQIDLTDVLNDPVVKVQRKLYAPAAVLMCFIIPTLVPSLWGESLVTAFFISVLRYVLALNATWLVNSAAHMWGNKPYDKFINPSQNFPVAVLAMGEGWHNYHHTFPYDYATSELGWKVNPTTVFIDFMARLGLAYDRKKVSPNVIRARVSRTGDGTWEKSAQSID